MKAGYLMRHVLLGVVAVVLSITLGAGIGHALPLAGTIWQNIPNPNDANDPANLTADHANFGPAPINYNSPPSAATAAGFLGIAPGAFTSLAGAFDPNGAINNSLVRITGTIGLNAGANAFVLGHDDGAILNIVGITGAANPACTGGNAGAVLCEPAPTSFVTTPFSVTAPATGNFDFTLWYTECCTPPARLDFIVNDVQVGGRVPEPASVALFGAGLLLLGFLERRRRKAS